MVKLEGAVEGTKAPPKHKSPTAQDAFEMLRLVGLKNFDLTKGQLISWIIVAVVFLLTLLYLLVDILFEHN